MLVKPAPGLQVRDPHTRLLVPKEGIEIDPDNLIWSRLLRDKDVVEVKDSKAQAKKADEQ